jgi:membrane associated rhomboid family serine protease
MLHNDFQTYAKVIGGLIAILWLLEGIDQLLLRNRLNLLGIRPRTQIGLRGILFAPLLHGSWSHLSANTIPLAVLGGLVIIQGMNTFAIATTVVWLISGLGAWLLGASNSLHIGASGLIFGYFGFLLSRSYFEQNAVSAAIAIGVALVYGPLLWGVLPSRRGVSWQGHLFGFIGGVVTARYLPQLQQWLSTLAATLQG